MRTRFQLILICALVLLAFYPLLRGEFCAIDDMEMVKIISRMTPADFAAQLFPTSFAYYRPVIGASYLLDKYLFGLDAGFMHLHNILLHCLNALLVFLVARKVLAPTEREGSYLPLAAALIFALHPVNTESVSWISGRTDVLSLCFLLLSTLALLNYRQTRARKDLLLSLSAFVLGFLTKETSIAFLPGFLLIWSARSESDAPARARSIWLRMLPALAIALSSAAAFLLLRHLAASAKGGRLGMTLKFFFVDWTHTSLVFLRAFGFYLKKLLIPYPLNFAINDIDPLYELLAIPLVLICIYIASRRTVVSAIFTTGMLLITPSFVLAFNQVAWTPYAERYIYMTCAFATIAALFYLRRNLHLPDPRVGTALVATVLTVMAVTTFNRSLIWQSNFTLCRDTVAKSPLSRDMRILYGSLLADRGDYENAVIQTRAANDIPGLGYDERADINLSCMVRDQGDIAQAMAICQSSLDKSKGTSARALDGLVSLWEVKRKRATGGTRTELDRKLFELRLRLFKLNNDYSQLYHLGAVCRSLGEQEKALKYYRHACYNLPEGNEHRVLAERAIGSMTAERAPR